MAAPSSAAKAMHDNESSTITVNTMMLRFMKSGLLVKDSQPCADRPVADKPLKGREPEIGTTGGPTSNNNCSNLQQCITAAPIGLEPILLLAMRPELG